MSLNFYFDKIKDKAELFPNGKPVERTKSLIFMTMFVEMGEITEKNVDEFFLRTWQHETCFGALTYERLADERIVDKPFTYAEIVRHIGLRTNVVTKSKAAFGRFLAEKLRNRANEQLYKQKEEIKDGKVSTDPGANRSVPDLQ